MIFLIAAVIAIFLGFIQKFGAGNIIFLSIAITSYNSHTISLSFFILAIHTIPSGVFGGLSIILFGLITVSGARIWVENQVDFKDSRNMLVAGIPGNYKKKLYRL